MTFCPVGNDHLISFEDDREAYCEVHEVRVVQDPIPSPTSTDTDQCQQQAAAGSEPSEAWKRCE